MGNRPDNTADAIALEPPLRQRITRIYKKLERTMKLIEVT